MNIGYFRVSKEDEKEQDLERQVDVVQNFFGVKFDRVFKERGSAYDLEKLSKRAEFLQMLDEIFFSGPQTPSEMFTNAGRDKKNIRLYVWDYDRIMRNIQRNLLFMVLSDLHDVTIFSYKDGKTKRKPDETPSETFARYMMMSIHAFTGQQYSYTISTNTKKQVERSDGITSSSYGKKWGNSFVAVNGERKKLSPEKAAEVRDFIIAEIVRFEKRRSWGYGPEIKKKVAQKFGLSISNAYISKLRREV